MKNNAILSLTGTIRGARATETSRPARQISCNLRTVRGVVGAGPGTARSTAPSRQPRHRKEILIPTARPRGGGRAARGDVSINVSRDARGLRSGFPESRAPGPARPPGRRTRPHTGQCAPAHRGTAQRATCTRDLSVSASPAPHPSQSSSSVSRPTAPPTAHRAYPTEVSRPLYYLRC